MAWQPTLILIVRNLINDINIPYQFSDNSIEQVLVIAGKYVQFDVNLATTYNIDIISKTFDPDPILIKDEIFTSIVCLKAACIIDQGTFRTKAALEGISTKLGPATLNVSGTLQGWKSILEHGPCALYDQLTEHWDVQNATAWAAVLSPFVGNRFDPRYLNSGPFRDTGNNNFYS